MKAEQSASPSRSKPKRLLDPHAIGVGAAKVVHQQLLCLGVGDDPQDWDAHVRHLIMAYVDGWCSRAFADSHTPLDAPIASLTALKILLRVTDLGETLAREFWNLQEQQKPAYDFVSHFGALDLSDFREKRKDPLTLIELVLKAQVDADGRLSPFPM